MATTKEVNRKSSGGIFLKLKLWRFVATVTGVSFPVKSVLTSDIELLRFKKMVFDLSGSLGSYFRLKSDTVS
jgi:hypothetical protein